MNAFIILAKYSYKQKKIKKYELSETDLNEIVDSDLTKKRKELDILTRKYNRLISEFGVLNQRVSKVMKTTHWIVFYLSYQY